MFTQLMEAAMPKRRTRQPKRAIVLGCGPTGMFATHALALGGYEVRVLSRKRRSEMFGAQYLHKPIPGLSGFMEPVKLTYRLWGTEEQYAQKIYGSRNIPFVSPSKLAGEHEAWDIRRAYYDAFSRYSDLIQPFSTINGADLGDIINDEQGWGTLIVSTIPAPAICTTPAHIFRTQDVWAVGDAPERGVFCPVKREESEVICNGLENPSWYRAANIFGYCTAEWPEDTPPPIPGLTIVSKPIDTSCDCWKGRVVRLGRFGAWDKSAYSHDGFYRMHGGSL
jgi:hypothetical protein